MRKPCFLLAVLFLFWVAPRCLHAQEKQGPLPVSPLQKNFPSYEASELPHQEIERVDHQVVAVCPTGARKHFLIPELVAGDLINKQTGAASLALQLSADSPAKNYLIHIYPSHNFW